MIRYATVSEAQKMSTLIIPFTEDSFDSTFFSFWNTHAGGMLQSVIEQKDFEGKKGQMTLLYPTTANIGRIILVGLGKTNGLSVRTWKQSLGSAVIAAQQKKSVHLGVVIPEEVRIVLGTKNTARGAVIGTSAAAYGFDVHREKSAQITRIEKIDLITSFSSKEKKMWLKSVEEGTSIADAMNWTRDLGNTTPTTMTPTYLSKQAQSLAKKFPSVTCRIFSRPEMKKLGMGCLLGVSQGSAEEPKFIIVEYVGSKKSEKPVVLIGKGITYDSGGLSLKPANYMIDMKFDMLGGATVLGAIQAAAALNIKKHIVGLIPACENMPSGSSYRPDDILIAMNGKSVLVDNTDAEGRLILADAICYANKKYTPKVVIDLATLTGACMVALGNERSGVLGTDQVLIDRLRMAGEECGELLWQLPLGEEFSSAMNCDIADIKNAGNVGGSGYGGASTGAAFLQFFTRNDEGETPYPWAHIDMSSCYFKEKGKSYIRGGANGFGVETLVNYLQS
ncbi:MAG: leucyl aminopeptidase [Candidatus Magasanikbacteria bacterium]|jgi:leucyl aminopeptidase|nr:leucyl aminopeptidase [Candidatus Magasanikbacteria bacterium]